MFEKNMRVCTFFLLLFYFFLILKFQHGIKAYIYIYRYIGSEGL